VTKASTPAEPDREILRRALGGARRHSRPTRRPRRRAVAPAGAAVRLELPGPGPAPDAVGRALLVRERCERRWTGFLAGRRERRLGRRTWGGCGRRDRGLSRGLRRVRCVHRRHRAGHTARSARVLVGAGGAGLSRPAGRDRARDRRDRDARRATSTPSARWSTDVSTSPC